MGPGLTLPQVIALVDKRLIHLEQAVQGQTVSAEPDNDLKLLIEEYNARFDIIADELASLKDTIMKLQTFTMEVNKTLMEDRIRILSETPTPLEQALNAIQQ
jgi:hypothetical protein